MRRFTRQTAFALLLTLLLSLLPVSALAAPGLDNFRAVNTYAAGQFADVNAASWYAANVQKAYELGLLKGSSDTTFNPDGNLTVAEALVLACRLNDIYEGGSGEFTAGSPWYQVYVDEAVRRGIITAGQFSAYTVPATRAQFITILGSALPEAAMPAKNEVEDKAIPDVPAGAAYYNAAYRLYRSGILTGDSSHRLNPDSLIRRSEVAAIATRVADPALRVSVTMEYAPALTAVSGLTVNAGSKDASLSWTAVDGAAGYHVYVSTAQAGEYSLKATAETTSAAVADLTPATTYYFKVAAFSNTKSGQKQEGPQSQPVSARTAAAPISYSGSGTQSITGVNIPAGDYYAEFKYQGTGNFIAHLRYGSKSYEQYAVANEIGSSAGRCFLDKSGAPITNGTLEVSHASGSWTIEFKPVSGSTTTNMKGAGYTVSGIFTAAGPATVTLTHNGRSNFIVHLYKVGGKSYEGVSLTNEIGSWSGQKQAKLTAGAQYFAVVHADGDWTLDFGRGEAVTNYPALQAPPKADDTPVRPNDDDDDDDDYGGSSDPSEPSEPSSGDSDLWSYKDVKSLDHAIEMANKGLSSISNSLRRDTGFAAADVTIVKTALSSADSAGRYLQEAISWLDAKTELKLDNGSTLRDYVQKIYDDLMEMRDTEVTEENVQRTRLELSMDAAGLSARGAQARVLTTQLVKATLGG